METEVFDSIKTAREKAQLWLNSGIDKETKEEVEKLLDNEKELLESFLLHLEFGTGGLRGVMGVGTSRINKYTIGSATQGLANYLLKQLPAEKISVAIAHDSRNNSRLFAETTAAVLSANNIHVHLFDELRPTPLLSFAVRELQCSAGIVITASHNPPEYNGYKVYWSDGGQIVPPHDEGIIRQVQAIQAPDEIKFTSNPEFIHAISGDVEHAYLRKIESLIRSKNSIMDNKNLCMVYSSLHGSGITLVPKTLHSVGFENVNLVEEQKIPDGNFPTVKSPNPEEIDAMKMALELGEKLNAELVLATDPDADRLGVAVRNESNQLVLLTGNQVGSLIAWYELSRLSESGDLKPNHFIVKTIVTSDLIKEIADSFDVKIYETLTGFKYIASVMREKEGKEIFLCGGEESYGYLVGDFVRDKDSVISAVVVSEMAAWAKSNGTTLWQMLMKIYHTFGLYHEELLSITIKGLDGVEKISEMMRAYRENPPLELGGTQVTKVNDYQLKTKKNLVTGSEQVIDLPKSNVLQFVLRDGSKISVRPSGTEPKIKFYFSLKEPLKNAVDYYSTTSILKARIEQIRKSMGV